MNELGGIEYFWRGVTMLNHHGLRRFVAIPLLVNIVVFAFLLWLGVHYFSQLTHWVATLLPTWLRWLNWLLWILFVISFLIVLAYTFTFIANLIAAPFNGLLSEKVEKILTGKKEITPPGWINLVKDIPRAFGRQIRFIVYYLLWAIPALILFIIPVIQVAAGPLWFLLNAWMMSVQYMDYPMDNHRISFRAMRDKMQEKRLVHLSFGCMVMLATLIPIINFIVMPAAVIGATVLWVEEYP